MMYTIILCILSATSGILVGLIIAMEHSIKFLEGIKK